MSWNYTNKDSFGGLLFRKKASKELRPGASIFSYSGWYLYAREYRTETIREQAFYNISI